MRHIRVIYRIFHKRVSVHIPVVSVNQMPGTCIAAPSVDSYILSHQITEGTLVLKLNPAWFTSPDWWCNYHVIETRGRISWLDAHSTDTASSLLCEVYALHRLKVRLLRISTFKLEEFIGNKIPKYAILSHRWEHEEFTYKDSQDSKGIESILVEYVKIKGCCRQVVRDGHEYVWVDDAVCGKRWMMREEEQRKVVIWVGEMVAPTLEKGWRDLGRIVD